jgi:hypothetical protein
MIISVLVFVVSPVHASSRHFLSVLILDKSIQDELKLDKDQRKQLKMLYEMSLVLNFIDSGYYKQSIKTSISSVQLAQYRYKQSRTQIDKANTTNIIGSFLKSIKTVLSPKQLARYEQLRVQIDGSNAMLRTEIDAKLQLSFHQEIQIAELSMKRNQRIGSITSYNDLRHKYSEIEKQTIEAQVKILTPQQRVTWTTIIGEPFSGDIYRFSFMIR